MRVKYIKGFSVCKLNLPLFILSALLFFSDAMAAGSVKPTSARFPGPQMQVNSPDQRYQILDHDCDQCEIAHFLTIKRIGKTEQRKILDYARHIELSWSPLSSLFYVNDAISSDETRCYLYAPVELNKIDLFELVLKLEKNNAAFHSNHHRYLTCTAWHKHQLSLEFRAYGASQENGYVRNYRYDSLKHQLMRR